MTFPWPFRDAHDALVKRARKGDREAFRALYTALHPAVHAFAARRTRSRADAEDVTARVFQTLLERLESIDEGRGVLPWALSVARNLIIDAQRAARPLVSEDELAGSLVDLRTPLADLLEKDDLRTLQTRLLALSAGERELIALRYADGLKHREIARLLGISEGAVRKRISRAVRELRDHDGPEGELAHDL